MRVADKMRYDQFLLRFGNVKEGMDRLQEMMATQKKITNPSDDPVVFSKAVELTLEKVVRDQMESNITQAQTLNSLYDVSFKTIHQQLTTLKSIAVSQATGSGDTSLRENAVEQIKSIIAQLVDTGNAMSGDTYIFGGKRTDAPPFKLNADYSVDFTVSPRAEEGNAVYLDRGYREKIGISGRDVFFDRSKILYESPANQYAGNVYSTAGSFAYVVDDTNDTIYRDGIAVTLDHGTYTGARLAKEIQNKMKAGFVVAYNASTRKFTIENNTTNQATFDWSSPLSTARNLLGFDPTDSTVGANGGRDVSDTDAGEKSFLVRISTAGATTGPLANRARYWYSIDGGNTWSAEVAVTTGGADTTPDITIDATNSTLYRNGVAISLTAGTYTGAGLAAEIQARLGAGYTVAYDATSRKFSVANSTGNPVTFNWSNAGATAVGVLGFDTVDSIVSNETADVSDFDAGMFIDNALVANGTNSRVKVLFGTAGNLVEGDTFEVKDFSTFAVLKDLKDALESNNSQWTGKILDELDMALNIVDQNSAYVGFTSQKIDALIEDNKAKELRSSKIISSTVNADLAELSAQYNTLSNTYEALIYSMSKIQEMNILKYLG